MPSILDVKSGALGWMTSRLGALVSRANLRPNVTWRHFFARVDIFWDAVEGRVVTAPVVGEEELEKDSDATF